jgi:hypothetical protein
MALSDDLPEHGLRRGDVATLVEHHPGRPGQEDGYSLEVFNAVGGTVAVVTVRSVRNLQSPICSLQLGGSEPPTVAARSAR